MKINGNFLLIDLDKCFECGELMSDMHHVIPKSKGGMNMIPLCIKCHGLVHGKDLLTMRRLSKEGLERAKLRGVKLGNPENLKYEHRLMGAQAMKEKANLEPINIKMFIIINDLRNSGNSFCEIAKYLNNSGYRTIKGCNFTDTGVTRIYKRYKK